MSFLMAGEQQALGRMLQAIVDPGRRRILRLLKEKGTHCAEEYPGLSAGDIERHLKLAQSTVSHHLTVLTRAGLLEVKKAGQRRCYQRNSNAVKTLTDTLRRDL